MGQYKEAIEAANALRSQQEKAEFVAKKKASEDKEALRNLTAERFREIAHPLAKELKLQKRLEEIRSEVWKEGKINEQINSDYFGYRLSHEFKAINNFLHVAPNGYKTYSIGSKSTSLSLSIVRDTLDQIPEDTLRNHYPTSYLERYAELKGKTEDEKQELSSEILAVEIYDHDGQLNPVPPADKFADWPVTRNIESHVYRNSDNLDWEPTIKDPQFFYLTTRHEYEVKVSPEARVWIGALNFDEVIDEMLKRSCINRSLKHTLPADLEKQASYRISRLAEKGQIMRPSYDKPTTYGRQNP